MTYIASCGALSSTHSRFRFTTSSVIFLHGAVNRVHSAPWSDCPNKNVFSDRLNQ